jgi:DNA-binding response OmpR family regulator
MKQSKVRQKLKDTHKSNVMKSDKGRILFVEDEHLLVDMYQQYLEQHGYDFLATKDIKEALLLTEFEHPDAVLLDIIIPKEGKNGVIDIMAEQGYDYLEAVKNNKKIKDIPVIVFTNLNTAEDRIKSTELGAIAYIFKGQADPQDVLHTIEAVLARKER